MAEDARLADFRESGGAPVEGLYVHVPFCPFRCAYCDFDFTTQKSLVPGYLAAVAREAAGLGGIARPRTVFFGGGTPSLLASADFKALAAALRAGLDLTGVEEWSIEANPETVTPEKARLWKACGVNRVSLGAQTFSDARLAALGRPAKVSDVRGAWEILRGAGFDNLNIDLIYGIPGTGMDEWRADLREALAFAPDHVSCYALTVEEKTPLGLAVRRGTASPVAEELSAALYREAVKHLAAAGIIRYEVSNFALSGKECRHNLNAWRGGRYLGLGPSAASFVGNARGANARGAARYARAVQEGGSAYKIERRLTAMELLREKALLGLRLAEGIPDGEIPAEEPPETLDRLLSEGLVARAGGRLVPTARGFLFADEISAALI